MIKTRTELTSHWQPPAPKPEGPACHPALERDRSTAYTLTTDKHAITCPACKEQADG